MTRPKLLDLFCGAGGAAMGYHRAGFDVIGVDIKPQPNYSFDAIHASPPCQNYSVTKALHTNEHAELIEPVRRLLARIGRPYVIENVEGARSSMINPVRLCGSSFGLDVRRHRLFETSWPVGLVPPCAHYLQPEPIDITGTGGPAAREPGQNGGIHRKPRNLAHARDAIGIDWMSRRELSQAIPPTYTQFIGEQLLAALNADGAVA
jgi:DNA (cytosine-5)-methyltransferase 1